MFQEIIDIAIDIAGKIPLVFILHPSTKIQLKKEGYYHKLEQDRNIVLIPRQNFLEFIQLTEMSEFFIIDSGGNQEEMSYTGKPTLILRKATERIEGLGKNIVLSKYDHEVINEFVKNYKEYNRNEITLSSPSKYIFEEVKKLRNTL